MKETHARNHNVESISIFSILFNGISRFSCENELIPVPVSFLWSVAAYVSNHFPNSFIQHHVLSFIQTKYTFNRVNFWMLIDLEKVIPKRKFNEFIQFGMQFSKSYAMLSSKKKKYRKILSQNSELLTKKTKFTWIYFYE